MSKLSFGCLIAFGCVVINLPAQLQTSLIIQSGMVVQRHQKIPVWGSTGAGSRVIASLNGHADSTMATSSGDWMIHLPALDEGGPFELSVRSGNDTLQYTDIYVGDVWLASGQSNMAFKLKDSDHAEEEINEAVNPEIRQFLVSQSLGNRPVDYLPPGSSWTPATTPYAGEFTAVGYYFAKNLYAHLNIPIGIINTSYGGTRIESWMSEGMLGFDEEEIVFGQGESYLQPTVAYNTMLHPLTRVPIKGFIWYQGESNMGNRETALIYGNQFKKLITSWRELWSMGDLPFLWVQIPNTGTEGNESVPGQWDALPMLRASQSRALGLPNTGEVISIDTGEPDIHPTNKAPVGERLSLVARSVVYGDSIIFSGPRYRSHRRLEDGKVEITFDHRGGNLVAKEVGDQSLRWFSIENTNGSLYPATAMIDSNRVLVWNDNITNPKTVRYAWEYNPYNVNFYNDADLPAAPFQFRLAHPGFMIETFKSTLYEIDKGESALLTWNSFGAGEASINHLPVDTIGGLRVWPAIDSTFTLKIRNRQMPYQEDSLSLHIRVREPDPVITLSSDAGGWISTGSEVAIHASVTAPEGGTITLVRFYVDGERFDSITQPPFVTTWIPEKTGTYNFTGIATNHRGLSQVSEVFQLEVYDLNRMKFEAENAGITGGKWIMESELASGGAFVDLTRDWTLTFSGFEMPADRECQLTICFMLNYGSPRVQDLLINGTFHGDLVFEAPTKDSWEKEYQIIPLKGGTNEISIRANWDYMSIDYITLEWQVDSIQTGITQKSKGSIYLVQNFPNPFTSFTRIGFTLPENGTTSLEIHDLSGRKMDQIVNQELDSGTYEFVYHSDALKDGFYLLKLTHKSEIRIVKMLKF